MNADFLFFLRLVFLHGKTSFAFRSSKFPFFSHSLFSIARWLMIPRIIGAKRHTWPAPRMDTRARAHTRARNCDRDIATQRTSSHARASLKYRIHPPPPAPVDTWYYYACVIYANRTLSSRTSDSHPPRIFASFFPNGSRRWYNCAISLWHRST